MKDFLSAAISILSTVELIPRCNVKRTKATNEISFLEKIITTSCQIKIKISIIQNTLAINYYYIYKENVLCVNYKCSIR